MIRRYTKSVCFSVKSKPNYIIKSLKMDQEVAEARARLAARYGAPTQIGGKGKSAHFPIRVFELHT